MGERAVRPILFLVPAVLLVVAGFQVGRVVTLDQSSWIGGGFGMFATYDYDDTRVVVAWFQTPDGEVPAEAVIDGDLVLRARVVPSEGNVRAIADAILEAAGVTADGAAGGVPADASALVVEVRGRSLSADVLTFPTLARVEVPV